eukprot:NODE_251_length_12882_cov_0.075334.p9 type:complete len:105 gc:universal NODE_251_length_12882_cov_0.075334:8474-8788(+)
MLNSFSHSQQCPIWNQMSKVVKGLGGWFKILVNCSRDCWYLPCCLYIIPSLKLISLDFIKDESILRAATNASSAWSKLPKRSYRMPIPYQSLGSLMLGKWYSAC